MEVQTNSPEIRQARRDIVELLLDNHPKDCQTCERDGSCELQDLAYSMGVDMGRPEDAARHHAAILKVLEACQKTGKIPGIASNPDNIQAYIDLGFRFVTAGSDLWYVAKGGEAVLRDLGRKPNRVM